MTLPAVGAILRENGSWHKVTSVTKQAFRRGATFTVETEPWSPEIASADDDPRSPTGVPVVDPTPTRTIATITEPAKRHPLTFEEIIGRTGPPYAPVYTEHTTLARRHEKRDRA